MKLRRHQPRRSDVTEKVSQNRNDMEAKELNLDRIATDVETVRETLEKLELDGTVEGTDEIEREIENAEGVTVEIFDGEDKVLETLQDEASDYQEEMDGRNDSSESDLKKVSLARAKIETQETVSELENAKEAIIRDIDFFMEQIQIAKKDIKESEYAQDELHRRIHNER